MAIGNRLKDNYITLKKASEISGYSQDHVGLLIRQEKIKGYKVGRNWLTTEKEIRKYISKRKFTAFSEYISLHKRRIFVLMFIVLVLMAGRVYITLTSVRSSSEQGFEYFNQNIFFPQLKIVEEEEKGTQVTNLNLDESGAREISIETE